jgi:hypothetical protein
MLTRVVRFVVQLHSSTLQSVVHFGFLEGSTADIHSQILKPVKLHIFKH